MGEITLYPGRVVARWYTDEETIWPGSIFDLSKYFFHSLRLDPEFTLGDLFRLLDREGIEFLQAVLGEDIEPLLAEAREPAGADAGNGIAFLRVYNVYAEGALRREFDGWGAWSEPSPGAWEKDPDHPSGGPIAVSLTPVNELTPLPLRYDPALTFRSTSDEEEYRTEIDITFVEFLKAVFFELTLHGPPEERDEMRAELRRRVDEIERGEAESIPAEDVFERLREQFGGEDEE